MRVALHSGKPIAANDGQFESMDFQSPGRRLLLKRAATVAAAAFLAPLYAVPSIAKPGSGEYLFKLGVASGGSSADGFVIWTRLAPEPTNGGGMPSVPVALRWEVAHDERLRRIAAQGEVQATPEEAHSVHVEVAGLEADRWYFYRFTCNGQESPVGRARTFPAAGSRADRVRFAFASCQHFGQGYFTAYQAMLEDDLDFVIHLGDYIYESTWGPSIRRHLPEPTTLAGYRNMHALYKLDPQLSAAHAHYPFFPIWDDHEVENDYAGPHSANQRSRRAFLRRRTAAYKAYYEHMPLPASAKPRGQNLRLYGERNFGNLVSIHLLDGRQYRSDQACQEPGNLGAQLIACPEREDPARSLLGAEQERWLYLGLSNSPARWKLIAQPLLMTQLRQRRDGQAAWWSDGWDGYPANRQRLLDHIGEFNIQNVVVIGGDIHSFWAADLKRNYDDPGSPAVASEFVTTSVTSEGPPQERFSSLLGDNPHIRYFEARRRGYTRIELTPDLWRTDMRVVDTVIRPDSAAGTLKSYFVEDGRAGPQEA
jgi:alkaline phosphatase D